MGEHHHADVGLSVAQHRAGVDSPAAYAEIQEHDVGTTAGHDLDERSRVVGLPHDDEVGLVRDDVGHAAPEQRLPVRDDHPYR